MCKVHSKFLKSRQGSFNDMDKKFTKFEWTKECQAAFELPNNFHISAPVLAYPDMSELHMLYTDDSHGCIGACVTHVHTKDS